MKLREIGHSRAGDKGDTSVVSFFVYDPALYDAVRAHLTPENVKAHFGELVEKVERFDVPSLSGFNFVMTGALAGGVTTSLALDPHGKSRSSLLLEMEIALPAPGEIPASSEKLRGKP